MRYLAHTADVRARMLGHIGIARIDDLYMDVPAGISQHPDFNLPMAQDELAVDRYFQEQSKKNHRPDRQPSFLGAGSYRHHVPAAVDAIIQRGEFLTSYTPYQPEIAQGTLQYLFEFQTQVALLLGMDVANASMYDGATATVEAVQMAHRVTGRKKACISAGLHPHYREVIETYGRHCGYDVNYGEEPSEDCGAMVVQYPDVFGEIRDLTSLAAFCKSQGTLLIVVVTEIIALGLLKAPGTMGADIVVAEGQSLGNSPNFGGPTVGLFATRQAYVRQMPGRLVGQTHDVDGQRGWVLTLSTREQHIRREKATSNICTNAGLCALAFTIHLSLLGQVGYQRLARLNHAKACELYQALGQVPGVQVLNKTFFNELTVQLSKNAAVIVERLAQQQILAGVPLSRLGMNRPNDMLIAATEMTTTAEIAQLCQGLQEVLA